MITEIKDSLGKYIVPLLENEELCHFALASKWSKSVCIAEIIKRAHGKQWLEAVVFLNRKFVENESNPIIEKIQGILEHFTNKAPFSFIQFLSSPPPHPIADKALNYTKKNFGSLGRGEKTNQFYTQLVVNQKNQAIVPSCIKIIEAVEMGKKNFGSHHYIYIDVSQSSLSIGNLACFSIARKQLDFVKERLSLMDNIFRIPMHYCNQSGHIAITLQSSDVKLAEVLRTIESLNELTHQVGLLAEVRMLELVVSGSMDRRMRSCFQSVLGGASHLPKLRIVLFEFSHVILDSHIQDISNWVEKRLKDNSLSLEQITLQCCGIKLKQVQTLTTNINMITKKPIKIDLAISDRHCEDIQEIARSEEQLSTPMVTVSLRVII